MSMRRKNGSIAICGYLHCLCRVGHSQYAYEYYLDLLKFAEKYKEPFDISMVINFEISLSDYLYLEKFPADFKFYNIRNNKLELQDLKISIETSRINNKDLIALRDPNTKLIAKEVKNNWYESEDTIMRALQEGYGENFGF